MKSVSIIRWSGQGGIVQVAGTNAVAKAAIRVLQSYDCEMTTWTVSGSKGERIYTYRVVEERWPFVLLRLKNLDGERQLVLFS